MTRQLTAGQAHWKVREPVDQLEVVFAVGAAGEEEGPGVTSLVSLVRAQGGDAVQGSVALVPRVAFFRML